MTDYRNRITALEYVVSRDLTPVVYAIRNTANGKVYIGSSVNVKDRWHTHRKLLRGGRHFNRHLQAAWTLYGEGVFSFEVIERVIDSVRLVEREQHWMDALSAYEPETGYNLRTKAESNLGKKMNLTDEQREQKRKAMMGNTYAVGIKPSLETIEKRRQKLIGRRFKFASPRSEKWYAFRERHAKMMKGRKHDWHTTIPPETRAKISASVKQARKAGLKVYEGFVDPNGVEVGPIVGLTDFCTERGLSHANMAAVYYGRRNHHKGWTVKRDGTLA